MTTKTTQLPFTEPEWKIPGYSGHVQGLQETFKKTPIIAQLETKDPDMESFIHTRTNVSPKITHGQTIRDPCNDPSNFKKAQPGILWPGLQETAIQECIKPPTSNIAVGDMRIDNFRTSYLADFKAPFHAQERVRSPNRNEDLAKTTANLKDIYRSSYNRVGEKRLQKMITTMRERMEAKMGNSNNNAFRVRKLFLVYDKEKTGLVNYEDFRQMCESFGMQLDDDSLLALYCIFDPDGTGYMYYTDLVQQIMHPDSFAFYLGYVDNSQEHSDAVKRKATLQGVHKKIVPIASELENLLKTFDAGSHGVLSEHDVLSGCAALGVVLSENELKALMTLAKRNENGMVDYAHFTSLFLS
jgi:Ca2+-binding EF-hand superfamily protein